jgi:hypothetical protein
MHVRIKFFPNTNLKRKHHNATCEAYEKYVFRKPEGKRPFRKRRWKLKDNIKILGQPGTALISLRL